MPAGAGLVVRIREERRFLPAILVQKVLRAPRLSPVPGSRLKLALVDGRVLPVVELGPAVEQIVVCHSEGETVALAGVAVEESGFFPASGEGIRYRDESVAPLDIAQELALALGRIQVERSTSREGAPDP